MDAGFSSDTVIPKRKPLGDVPYPLANLPSKSNRR
jgi:hypothetical protein